MSSERQSLNRRVLTMDDLETVPPWFIRHIAFITRAWGVLTLTVIWASAIWTLQEHYHKKPVTGQKLFVSWYLIGIGVCMVFIESIWIIDKCACCRREGCCCAVWKAFLWLDNWKRGIFYIVLSIPAFIEGLGIYFSLIAGAMMIILGCLYITKTFRYGGYTMVREIRNTQYVESGVPRAKVVTMEVTTQTEDDMYYGALLHHTDKQTDEEKK